LNNILTLSIVCNQWGDTGKGKIVDLFAEWADIIARGTGGANAGHTIEINGKVYVFHLVPSGILWDGEGKINIIGRGVALDPRIVIEELGILREEGKSYNKLQISLNAHLVLPQHLVMDRVKESDLSTGRIGTTGRGIGPLYVDHYDRIGLVVNDLLNKDIFAVKLKRNLERKVKQLRLSDPEIVEKVMRHEHLENGIFYHPTKIFDVDAIIERYMEYGKELRGMINDTEEFMRRNVNKGSIKTLLEGAQGLLLSVDYGSYPYVTSSDCSVKGLAKGVGISEKEIDLTLGIVKAFYMTRVGEGPFPTEIGGEKSEEWCRRKDVTKEFESESFSGDSVNNSNQFLQGIGIRVAGNEYGATTGRPRRVGWLDLPLLRHAIKYNGQNIILTKLDVLDDCEVIKICSGYKYTGSPYNSGQKTIRFGDIIRTAIPKAEVLKHCQPVYEEFEGWKTDITGIRKLEDLPEKLEELCRYISVETDTNIRILSVGPDRNETIFMD
jgi:adenylosuccinate synthase